MFTIKSEAKNQCLGNFLKQLTFDYLDYQRKHQRNGHWIFKLVFKEGWLIEEKIFVFKYVRKEVWESYVKGKNIFSSFCVKEERTYWNFFSEMGIFVKNISMFSNNWNKLEGFMESRGNFATIRCMICLSLYCTNTLRKRVPQNLYWIST